MTLPTFHHTVNCHPVVSLIMTCYFARIPVLLVGSYGVGKTALLADAAYRLGIPLITRDLSLMEPLDLVGIPYVNSANRTAFAPPAFLPSSGKGLLAMEELNRAPSFVRAPCLQLLTAGTLNDYRLPPGWLTVAAINPSDGEFQVDTLDPALESRFMTIQVVPDATYWLPWARRESIHQVVIDFIEMTPNVFDDANANPRSWTYVSKFLMCWETIDEECRGDLLNAVTGLVSDVWAAAFVEFYNGCRQPLRGDQVACDYTYFRGVVKRWTKEGRLDLLNATFVAVRRHLVDQDPDALRDDTESRNNIRQWLNDIPPDMAVKFKSWIRGNLPGFDGEDEAS